MKEQGLGGRVAVVTGSTSGIGLSIAGRFAAAGAKVVLNGLGDASLIRGLEAQLRSEHGTDVVHIAADLSRGAEATRLVEQAVERFGRVDILVNNAGVQHVAPVEEFPPERWEFLIALLLSSAFYTIRASLPGMRTRNWGRIINVASAHGLVASPFKAAYVSAKHGVLGLTKTVALETAETGITINAICPGFVRTPLVDAQVADQARVNNMNVNDVVRNVILASQPSKRFVEPEEVAEMAVFLCSDAARSITGAALSMDGGWTAR